MCKPWAALALSRDAWHHRVQDASGLPVARARHPWPQLWAVQRPGNLLPGFTDMETAKPVRVGGFSLKRFLGASPPSNAPGVPSSLALSSTHGQT